MEECKAKMIMKTVAEVEAEEVLASHAEKVVICKENVLIRKRGPLEEEIEMKVEITEQVMVDLMEEDQTESKTMIILADQIR
jgi:hypothetical protein